MISMNTEVISSDHTVALPHAVDILQHGGLVAFPTDTVYGLAALPTKAEYIESLYAVKGRDSARAIALLLNSPEQLSEVSLSPNEIAITLAKRFWPGPLTLVVPRKPSLPDILSPTATIGVRIPDHKFVLQLLELTGPLGVTSANLSGHENTCTAQEVLSQLDGRFHLLIDGGRTPGSVPSTVVDCTTLEPKILRLGPISQAEILKVIGE
jgi:L-threonylcarbamoyladenylate synthase